MAKRRRRELVEADAFRARVLQLRAMPDADWNDWEADWLEKEAARHEDYIYTDKEKVILNQLIASSTLFEGYNGYSISELLCIAHRDRANFDEDSEEFVERLWRRMPLTLRVRQLNRLASLCRLTEPVGRDEEVDRVLREIRRQDQELHPEVPAFVQYTEAHSAY